MPSGSPMRDQSTDSGSKLSLLRYPYTPPNSNVKRYSVLQRSPHFDTNYSLCIKLLEWTILCYFVGDIIFGSPPRCRGEEKVGKSVSGGDISVMGDEIRDFWYCWLGQIGIPEAYWTELR